MANASRDQLLRLAVVLQAGDFRRSRKCGHFFGDLKGSRAVYDVVAAVVVADGDRRRTGVGVVAVGYAVLGFGGAGAVDHFAVVRDSDGGSFRGAVIDKGSRIQRDSGCAFLRLDGHGHLTRLGIGVVVVALYHVIHGVGACVRPLGNGFRIGICRACAGIHHGTAGGGAYVHQVLGLPGIGQVLGRRGLGQLCAGFLDGKLYLRFCEGIVSALLCGDDYSCIADIFVVGDVHAVIAVCQRRTVSAGIRTRCRDGGGLCGAVIVVGVYGRCNRVIRLQIVAGQRDRHSNRPGLDRPLDSIRITDSVLASVRASHLGIEGVQCDRFPRASRRGIKGGGDTGRVNRHCVAVQRGNTGGGHGGVCGPIVVPLCNGHLRHNRLGLHGKGPDSADSPIVGDRPLRLDRDGPGALDGQYARVLVNLGAGSALCDAPFYRSISGAAGGPQAGNPVTVVDMLGYAGNLYRRLFRRDDLRRGFGGEGIVPAGHICNGGRIASGNGQQAIGDHRIVIFPRDRVLVRVNDGFPVQHRELRLLLGAVVQEGELRRLDLGCDGLGGDGHGNRGCVRGHAGVVGGLVYLIIDGVGAGVGPGGNVGGEIGPIQRIDQESHIGYARRDQRLRLAVVGQRVDFRGSGGDRRGRLCDIRRHCVGVADGVFGCVAGHLNLGSIQRDGLPRAHVDGVKGGGDAGRVDGHRVAVDCGDAGGGHSGICGAVIVPIPNHNGSRNRLGRGGEGPLVGDGQIIRVSGVGGCDGHLANAGDLHLAGGRVHDGRPCRFPSHRTAAGAAAGGQRERVTVDCGSGSVLDHQRSLSRLTDGEGGGVGGNSGQIVVAACGVGDGNGVGALVHRSGVAARPIVLRYGHDCLDFPLRKLDRDRGHLHFAVVLKAVGGQLNGDIGQRLALNGHLHLLVHKVVEVIMVFISLDLVIDGVIPRFGAGGNCVAVGCRGAVQRVLDCAAAGRAGAQQLMGLAVVGDIGCGRGRSKHDIRLLDDKRLGA